MLKNNSRRRTTGGVFFHIAKSKLSPEQHAVLFPPSDWKKFRETKKRRKQAKKRAEKDKSKQQKSS